MPKISNFYPLYEKKLDQYKDKEIRMLEIGVQDGSSIRKWKEMSPKWDVWGMDIDPKCKADKVIIADQLDESALDKFKHFDIIIDDGGHTMMQQIKTFEHLFPSLNKGGLYVIEDLHTSFWPEFSDYPISTMDYLLKLVPHIHHKETNNDRLKGNSRLQETAITAIEFYPSIVFIWK